MTATAARSRPEGTAAATLAQTSSTWRLPVELLLQCLMASDMVTRIRASHVCHTWREVALAERRLWNSFLCTEFRNKQHEEAMFCLLEELLLRSHGLSFHLRIPHLHDRTEIDYRDQLLRTEGFDISRLAAYHGPLRLFEQLNPARTPLPNLVCLDVLELYSDGPDTGAVNMTALLSSRCLPNLRQLIGPTILFPTDRIPLPALQSISFACLRGIYHHALFAYCPRLVRMDIIDSIMGTPLPNPPVPPSLEEVSIRCSLPRALDFAALMGNWTGIRVRRLVAHELYSMQNVLPLFLASHAHTVDMRLPVGNEEVVLAAVPDGETAPQSSPDTVWTLSPSSAWAAGFLASIEKPASDRLTSISVALTRLGALLRAQLVVPGLEKLEFFLDRAAQADGLPLRTGEECFLRAPRLRIVRFTGRDDAVDSLEEPLNTLRASFRSILLYDSELLDAIVVSRRAEHTCAGFAEFAEDYAPAAREY